MADYLVTWEINVEADSPLEAAHKARSYQLPGTTATVFDITDEHGNTERIDLPENPAQQSSQTAPAVPERIIDIGRKMISDAKNNDHYTADPVFVVQKKRLVTGIDTDYASEIGWFDCDCGLIQGEEADALEREFDLNGEEPDGYTRTGYAWEWEYVDSYLTREAAEARINGGPDGRVMVESAFRNSELQAVRNFIMSLAAPQPDHSPDAGKVLAVAIPDSDFDETDPIHQAADAYSYACEIMEQYQTERVEAGKEPGTTGSLCDGIAWLYQRIQELEDHSPDAGKVVPVQFEDYDCSAINDWGGGNVGWWQDYIRSEINRANEFWREQVGPEPLYTHPAPQPVQSENEAKLVKEAYDAGYSEAMLYARVCCGRLDNPENTTDYRDCARFLDLIFEGEINEAARLRASQQEGSE